MSGSINLDAACGSIFTYRELIECGKTWHEYALRGEPIDNLPREEATWEALRKLGSDILDPLTVALGRPHLSYGFASTRLTRRISARIAPALDQHASHERNEAGLPVCPRLGAAVDLWIPDRPSTSVARWVFENTAFDRLYLYGDDHPLHVSHGPEGRRMVVEMVVASSGRRVPRVVRW